MRNLTAYAKGVMGETAASEAMIQMGYSPVERRYRSPYGEVDWVMLDGETLVFVEVKARQSGNTTSARQAVTPQKQRRLIQTARCYLGEHPEYAGHMIRFDIVTVTPNGIVHLPNAFQGKEW